MDGSSASRAYETPIAGIPTVVYGKPRPAPTPPPRLGCSRVLIVSSQESVVEAYAARQDRGAQIYGLSSFSELIEVLDNIAAKSTPLGGAPMIVLDARAAGLHAADIERALGAVRWEEPTLVLTANVPAFDAFVSGPTLVVIVRDDRGSGVMLAVRAVENAY
jgi:hypothetical protein